MLEATKILTVSSDPVLVDFLQKELNSGGFEIVNTQHTGIQLKDIVDLEEPQFIILDIMMPTLDGIGICLQLRQWTRMPILMLTKWGASDDTVRGMNLGSDDYLTEPFDVETLKERIDLTLKRNATVIEHYPTSNN